MGIPQVLSSQAFRPSASISMVKAKSRISLPGKVKQSSNVDLMMHSVMKELKGKEQLKTKETVFNGRIRDKTNKSCTLRLRIV